MFSKLKKFILGDKRPVVGSVTHPVIGTLTYSDDDEAWLTDPKSSPYGFGFYISGDWDADGPEIRPASALVDHAAQIAAHPEAFRRLVEEFIDSQLRSVRSLAADKDEIQKLRVYRVTLMWPERPADGEIELRTSFDTDRMWGCAYLRGKPAPHLGFSGLDR
jgi:hypothetical protein